MTQEAITINLTSTQRIELDRLAGHFAAGDRAAFLVQALDVMSAKARMDRLTGIAAEGQAGIHEKNGHNLTETELNSLTRRITKGK